MGGWSTTQQRALAITPKATSSLSIPASLFLLYEIWCDYRSPRGTNAVQHALVGMSVIDILSSSAWFMSTWFVPEGDFALSRGNRGTCTYQGFMLQLAVGAPLYNSSLALFYLLMIKYNWTDSMLRGIEVWVHAIILSFSIGTSILLVPLEQYNHIGAVCWVIGDPQDCGDSSFQGSDVPCERGNHAWLYGLTLFYGPLWVCVILCVYSIIQVYLTVRTTMVRGLRHSLSRGGKGKRNEIARSKSKSGGLETEAFAVQAVLYTVSFLVTWLPSTLWSIAHWFQFSAYWLDYMSAFCEPLQGFWNMLIFIRNRPRTKSKIRNAFAFVFCSQTNETPRTGTNVSSVVASRSSYKRSLKSSAVQSGEFGPITEGDQGLEDSGEFRVSGRGSTYRSDGSGLHHDDSHHMGLKALQEEEIIFGSDVVIDSDEQDEASFHANNGHNEHNETLDGAHSASSDFSSSGSSGASKNRVHFEDVAPDESLDCEARGNAVIDV